MKFILHSTRHGATVITECSSITEAVATAWAEIEWNQAKPIYIELPDGSRIERAERPPDGLHPEVHGSLDDLIEQYDREQRGDR